MKLTVSGEDKNLLLLACEGRISQADFEPGRDPLESLLGSNGLSRKVLLNMEKTNYIDSSGIGWLVICHRHFAGAGGQLILHSVPARVFQVLELIGLPKVMHIAQDEAAARSMALGDNQ
jgi:anti-anti-sigma factor